MSIARLKSKVEIAKRTKAKDFRLTLTEASAILNEIEDLSVPEDPVDPQPEQSTIESLNGGSFGDSYEPSFDGGTF